MAKINLNLVFKQQLIPKAYFLVFQTESEVDFKPGQFFSLEVEPKTYRAYSVAYLGKKAPNFEIPTNLPDLESGNYICFMISTKPGGIASGFIEKVEVGASLQAVGPSGKFATKSDSSEHVFVSTGTGLAPFVPMIENLLIQNPENKIDLFFGCWVLTDNFADKFLGKFLHNPKYPNFKMIIVAEDLQGEKESQKIFEGKVFSMTFEGRVTTVIPKLIPNLADKNYYLCGHPMMVAAMNDVLVGEKVPTEKIVMEKFGR